MRRCTSPSKRLSSSARRVFGTLQQTALDTYLPLLTSPSPQICTSIAQLLASTLRQRPYRRIVSEWVPPSERRAEQKGKRGWEKAESANSPSRQGGWVARQLVAAVQRKDVKVSETARVSVGEES